MSWTSPHGTQLPDWHRRTLVMGIMNLTEDSFSDGGQLRNVDEVLRRAETLLLEGADVLDIGGESSRPGATPITAAEEIKRVIPSISAIRHRFPEAAISVDTYKATVAQMCIESGADIINDIEGAKFESLEDASPMAAVCARLGCPLILMHRRRLAHYRNFWPEVLDELRYSIRITRLAGVPSSQIWTDPGFGFGKTHAQNLSLVRNLSEIAALGYPVLLGTSRKSTLGHVLNQPIPHLRDVGDAATAVWGIAQGCSMIRVHDVAALKPVIRMADALRQAQTELNNL